jgi:hypothetical protein
MKRLVTSAKGNGTHLARSEKKEGDSVSWR